ncbi:MAG TPA: protein-glutamate O-methyltransferase CheR [Polyangiales bacterium]|nr:protein-glutamate O-methyltransferase CheR [Polyangiales bacterium]
MAVPVTSLESLPRADDERRLEALEIELLLTGLAERYGYDFRHYARASLTRRIRRAMNTENVTSISGLQTKLLHDAQAAMRFVAAVSVHTTAMFRDADVYKALRDEVIPMLRTYPFVRVWHAGCSSGEEVYSLAILLEEAGVYDRCRIYATDISDSILERARQGVFPLRAMREHTRAYQLAGGTRDFSSYYVTDHEAAVFRSSLRRQLVFSQHNLVCDSAFNEFQLIVCRNVLLYFDQSLRQRAHELFHSSLTNFGVLVLGKKESLRYTPYAEMFQELREGSRIYRRVR